MIDPLDIDSDLIVAAKAADSLTQNLVWAMREVVRELRYLAPDEKTWDTATREAVHVADGLMTDAARVGYEVA